MMAAIYKREFKSYFSGMMGYLLIILLSVVGGIYMWANNLLYGSADFAYTLYSTTFVFLVYIPILTMRSFAEERKAKTDQLLLTSPVSITGIVLGKYLAMLTVFGLSVLVFALMPLVLSLYGTVALGQVYASLLCYFLMGAACIAVGTCVSCLAENQLSAFVATFGLMLLSYLMKGISGLFTAGSMIAVVVFLVLFAVVGLVCGLNTRSLPVGCGVFCVGCGVLLLLFRLQNSVLTAAFVKMMDALDLFTPFVDYIYGVFDLTTLVYYLSVMALFLFLAGLSLEKRRWN